MILPVRDIKRGKVSCGLFFQNKGRHKKEEIVDGLGCSYQVLKMIRISVLLFFINSGMIR